VPGFRSYVWQLILASVVAAGGVSSASAQEAPTDPPESNSGPETSPLPPLIAAEHHPWARFPVGSWKRVRIVEQTLDGMGGVSSESVTIRVERLDGVGPHYFSLTQDISIEVGGRKVEVPPKSVTLGLVTEEPGEFESATPPVTEDITFEGRTVEAQVFEVATTGDVHSVTTRVWYSPDEPPHVLRSITQAFSPASQESVWIRSRKVLAGRLPLALRATGTAANDVEKLFPCAFVEEEHTNDKAVRHSILAYAAEVPGGLAARWTKETNSEGRVVRREVETLLDWGIAAKNEKNGTSQPALPQPAGAPQEPSQ
jgi:hypothetical protein